MAAGALVWEWQNEFGNWRPYSPQISAFLESNKNSPTPLPLGMVDPMLYLYSIDVQNLLQIRQGTGKQRTVRRTVLSSSSPLAKGITWQWEGDVLGSWCDFDIEIIEFIDDCFNKGQSFIDLSKTRFSLPYHIDLKAMTQKRIETGRVRNIQRVFTSTSYPHNSSAQSSGTKRSSTGAATFHKRLRTSVTSTVSVTPISSIPATSLPSSSTMTSSGFNISSGSNFPMSSGNVYPSLVNGQGSVSMLPKPNIFVHRGPVTRRRYNQTVSSFSQLNQAQGPVSSQPSSSLSSTSAFSLIPSQNSSVSQTAAPFMSFSNVHHPQSSSNLGGVSMFGGGAMFGFQPSSSGMSMPHNHVHSTGLNPAALLLGGNKSSRIKPSAQGSSGGFASTSGFPLPRFDRIPNFTHKSSRKNNKAADKDTLSNYADKLDSPPADEDCCICCEKLIEASGHGTGTVDDHVVYKLDRCSHMFHKLCLTAMFESGTKDGHLQCPTCKTIYGEKVGNCPKGEMEYKFIDTELQGYEGCQTIQIMYHIHGGTQGPEHPQPGKRFSARGFPRVGYLPDCDKGRMVLQLLIIAWKRKLTFTIGSSTTTGEDNTVTWNEIHHKTELGSNYSGHGYPDPNYLDNVLLELAVHGITEKDLSSS